MHAQSECSTGLKNRLRIICPAFPAINIYSSVARVMTALGPVCIATAARGVAGWDAEVIDENNYRDGPKDEVGRPDHAALQLAQGAGVVGLYGGLTSTIPRLFEIAALYKTLGVRVIAGGRHFVEGNAEEALRSGVDVVVLGEGDKTIVELLECFQGGGDLSQIHGIAFLKHGRVVLTPARAPIANVDELPIPDFSLLHYGRMKYFPVSGTRGCGMDCEFCTVKGKPRFASAERMMAQFASIYEEWGGKTFFIVDDLFGQNRNDTLRLCGMLRDYQDRLGAKFSITVQIRLDRARDHELLQAMRWARINNVAIGFESPIPEELEAMNKRLKPQEMVDLTRRYRQAGFRVHGMFIFGYPAPQGQPFRMSAEDRVGHFRRFIRQSHLDTVQVLLPIPFPGTQLTDRLKKENRVYSTDAVGLEYYDGNFPLFQPDEPMTAEDMHAASYRIMSRFYGPRHLLAVAIYTIAFPAMTLWARNFRAGWQRWYRKWMGSLYRSGGWLLLRKWTIAFRQDGFVHKLAQAKRISVFQRQRGSYGS